jgi:hypothetical protein
MIFDFASICRKLAQLLQKSLKFRPTYLSNISKELCHLKIVVSAKL